MIKLFRDVFAFSEKELSLMTRFRLSFVLASFFDPISKIVPILLIYYGFLHFSGAASFGEITKETYIVFLGIGMFTFTFFQVGCMGFARRFQEEKFWKTIDALFISPVNMLSYILGFGLSQIINSVPVLLIFLGAAFFVKPVSIMVIVLVMLVVLAIYSFTLSFGLIWGSVSLHNEGLASIFPYIQMAWNFFSCFYYPLTVLPTEFGGFLNLRLIAEINPVFQALGLIRGVWIAGEFNLGALLYIAAFALVMPFIATYIFKKSWQTLGVEGY